MKRSLEDLVLDLNKFQIIRRIGEGQFGIVYLIEDRVSKQPFAAKINKQVCVHSIDQKVFMKEIQTFLKIKYPNIFKNQISNNLKKFSYVIQRRWNHQISNY